MFSIFQKGQNSSKTLLTGYRRLLHSSCLPIYFFAAKIDGTKDYYAILNVKQTDSSADIKKQYYKLVKQYHPDLNKSNEEIFKKINEAYEILGDEATRSEYNVMRMNPFGNQSSGMGGNASGAGGMGQSNAYGKYYNYGNRKGEAHDYKRYEQSYYSSAETQREQSQFYDSAFKNSQFYKDIHNDDASFGQNDYEPNRSAQERMNIKKQKIMMIGAVVLTFYIIFDILLYRVMNQGPEYKIYDPQSRQTYITDEQTYEQLRRRSNPRYDEDQERLRRSTNFNYDNRREKF